MGVCVRDIEYLETFHNTSDTECEECKSIDKSYPKICRCGGLVHIYEYYWDDVDSEMRNICDKCKEIYPMLLGE